MYFLTTHDTKEVNDYMGVVLNFCCLQRNKKKSLNVLLFLTKSSMERPKMDLIYGPCVLYSLHKVACHSLNFSIKFNTLSKNLVPNMNNCYDTFVN